MIARASVRAAVLAAGRARRYGAQKLLRPLDGQPLLRHALRAAGDAFAGNVMLITGQDNDDVAAAGADLADAVVFNPDFADGIGTSIAAGARTCRTDVDALAVILADQPLVDANHLRKLADCWDGVPDRIVATAYAGTFGPPVIFGRDYFDELGRLAGDRGARAIVEAHGESVVSVEFAPASIDIDLPEDLAEAARRLSTSQK